MRSANTRDQHLKRGLKHVIWIYGKVKENQYYCYHMYMKMQQRLRYIMLCAIVVAGNQDCMDFIKLIRRLYDTESKE